MKQFWHRLTNRRSFRVKYLDSAITSHRFTYEEAFDKMTQANEPCEMIFDPEPQ